LVALYLLLTNFPLEDFFLYEEFVFLGVFLGVFFPVDYLAPDFLFVEYLFFGVFFKEDS